MLGSVTGTSQSTDPRPPKDRPQEHCEASTRSMRFVQAYMKCIGATEQNLLGEHYFAATRACVESTSIQMSWYKLFWTKPSFQLPGFVAVLKCCPTRTSLARASTVS